MEVRLSMGWGAGCGSSVKEHFLELVRPGSTPWASLLEPGRWAWASPRILQHVP
jgi:hypothetical protein